MAPGFEDREKAMEDKWAHDEALLFRVITRRNKLLALWAAGEMGLEAKAAQDYVTAILGLEIQGCKDEDLVQKIHRDFTERKIARSEYLIRTRMEELAAAAKEEIMRAPEA